MRAGTNNPVAFNHANANNALKTIHARPGKKRRGFPLLLPYPHLSDLHLADRGGDFDHCLALADDAAARGGDKRRIYHLIDLNPHGGVRIRAREFRDLNL